MNQESFSSLCDCSAVSEYMQHAFNVLLNMHETCTLHACLPAPVQYCAVAKNYQNNFIHVYHSSARTNCIKVKSINFIRTYFIMD